MASEQEWHDHTLCQVLEAFNNQMMAYLKLMVDGAECGTLSKPLATADGTLTSKRIRKREAEYFREQLRNYRCKLQIMQLALSACRIVTPFVTEICRAFSRACEKLTEAHDNLAGVENKPFDELLSTYKSSANTVNEAREIINEVHTNQLIARSNDVSKNIREFNKKYDLHRLRLRDGTMSAVLIGFSTALLGFSINKLSGDTAAQVTDWFALAVALVIFISGSIIGLDTFLYKPKDGGS